MIELVPNYYKKFRCTADKCKHSCCVGWEIDIDEQTLDRYCSVQGDFGQRLAKGIDKENACFILDERERCPFLNEKGLCDIIINLGEDKLCQICTDHPRFRNYYSGCVEKGIGLCCEEAARLILTETEPFHIIGSYGEMTQEEREFFAFRNELFNIAGNSAAALDDCITAVAQKAACIVPKLSDEQLYKLFTSLEIMDGQWKNHLEALLQKDNEGDYSAFDEYGKRLLIYFLYRHLADSLFDENLKGRTAFCLLSVLTIRRLCRSTRDMTKITETVRLYSAEIEYSDENTAVLYEMLG